MTRWLSAVGVIAVCVALAPSLGAQWPSYPTPGVPRTADGKPNLDAPTPRTADGKVDFSGIWQLRIWGWRRCRRWCWSWPRCGCAGSAPATTPPDPNAIPRSQFGEVAGRGCHAPAAAVGRGAEEEADGRQQQGQPGRVVPADRPDAVPQPSAAAADRPDQEPDAHHLRVELRSALHLHGRPAGAEQRPDAVVVRLLARLVGGNDTLVVETTNFRGDERAGWLDVNGSPYTDALKMTERFRRPNFGTLEIDVTIDDPKAYTKPFTVRVNQRIMVDQEMIEFICNENERSSHHIEPPEWTKKPANRRK